MGVNLDLINSINKHILSNFKVSFTFLNLVNHKNMVKRLKLRKYYKKKIILIDRFVDSTVAYQHFGMGVNLDLINSINKHILSNFKVSFTFLNLVNHENMVKRLRSRKSTNRYDNFKKNFYNKVQKGFVKLSNKNKRKYQIIDSNLDIKLNEKYVLKKIEKLIK